MTVAPPADVWCADSIPDVRFWIVMSNARISRPIVTRRSGFKIRSLLPKAIDDVSITTAINALFVGGT